VDPDLVKQPRRAAQERNRRRIDAIGIFPTHDAIIRLVGAVLAEQSDEWAEGRHYFGLDILTSGGLTTIAEEVTESPSPSPPSEESSYTTYRDLVPYDHPMRLRCATYGHIDTGGTATDVPGFVAAPADSRHEVSVAARVGSTARQIFGASELLDPSQALAPGTVPESVNNLWRSVLVVGSCSGQIS